MLSSRICTRGLFSMSTCSRLTYTAHRFLHYRATFQPQFDRGVRQTGLSGSRPCSSSSVAGIASTGSAGSSGEHRHHRGIDREGEGQDGGGEYGLRGSYDRTAAEPGGGGRGNSSDGHVKYAVRSGFLQGRGRDREGEERGREKHRDSGWQTERSTDRQGGRDRSGPGGEDRDRKRTTDKISPHSDHRQSRDSSHTQSSPPAQGPHRAASIENVDMLPHRRAAAARKAERAAAAAGDGAAVMGAGAGVDSSMGASTSAASKPPQGSGSSTAQQQRDQGELQLSVPRNPGITDGVWDDADQRNVQSALADADATAATAAITATSATGRIDSKGFVLLGKSLPSLQALCTQYGQPRYRARQLMDGVLQGARSLDHISNVPAPWRAQMAHDGVRTGRSIIHQRVESPCGTRKFLLQLADGRVVETVGIPADTDPANFPGEYGGAEAVSKGRLKKGAADSSGGRKRLTVCVSSQVGCPMRCSFCATGKGGFARNLAPHEIMDQVLTVQEEFKKRVSNVVFMGMGEPLLNLQSVVASYHLLNQELGIGGRFITVSTVGAPNAIPRLARANLKSTLAVSIHAPNQALRESIIPSAKAYPIHALMEDCATYYRITGRRVTFEYTLLAGVNDGEDHARELAALLRAHNLMSHVNVIPWNPVDESQFKRPSRNSVMRFVRALEAMGLPTTIRMTRGLEAAAACGQLRNLHQKDPVPGFAMPA